MKRFLSIITFLALVLMCQCFSAHAKNGNSRAVQFLEAKEGVKGSKYMDIHGFMMKVAKAKIKKTPAIAIMDNIECLYMFSFKDNAKAEAKAFVTAAEKMLKSYTKASEVKDNISHSIIYLDELDGNVYHEIVMLVTWPNVSMMVFQGNFTEESLRQMEEISKKQRAGGKGGLSGI